MTPDAVLSALAAREAVGVPALLLVAHPDDEVLGASVALRCLSSLVLVHATDAAGGTEGTSPVERFAELDAALALLGAAPARVACGLPDGQLINHVETLAGRIAALLPPVDLLVTHAFEGGHPDHDACALAAHMACAGQAGRPIIHLEFAVYARIGGVVRTNAFAPAAAPATVLALSPEERAAKQHALAAFASQRHVVDRFPLAEEVLRVAPAHEFGLRRAAADVLFAAGDEGREARWRAAAVAALSTSPRRGR